ncbi:MAG: MFS transporter [Sterolibacterium sp.]|jgi:Na+/melibiose symporter-like transporter
MAAESSKKLTFHQLFAFALPGFALSMMLGPIGNFLPVFYAKHTSISMASIGLALLLTRIADAFSDQIVGYLSDITKSRFGQRKPWMVAGTLVSMGAALALYNPGPEAGFAYFFVAVLFLYFGWTMVAVPHMAWSSEITRDYNERSKVSSFSAVLSPLGFIVILGVPYLPFLKSTEISPQAVAIMGLVILVALPTAVGWAVTVAPRGHTVAAQNHSLRDLFNSVRSNRPFWHFMAYAAIGQISMGLLGSAMVVYMDFHLKLGDKISLIFIVNMLVMLLTVPLWLKIVYRIGKHRALAASGIFSMLLLPLVLLIEPGPDALYPFLAWMVALAVAGGANALAVGAIMGDIVDYDILKTRANRAGNYYAFMGLLTKASAAVGGGLGFALLGAMGFDAKAQQQTAMAIMGLKLTFVWIPVFLGFFAVALILMFPLDARRHGIIRRRLEQRTARNAAGATP